MEISSISSGALTISPAVQATPSGAALEAVNGCSEQLAAVIGELLASIDSSVGQNLDVMA
jgi:hypothetical protein